MKGTYTLIINKKKKETLKIGALGKIEFKKGYYTYTGSAMNSLIPRLKRHLSTNKKLHWHIDYLLKNAKIEEIIFTDSPKKIECQIAKKINKQNNNIEKFGCGDCNCISHLTYFKTKKETIKTVKNAYKDLNMTIYNLEYLNKLLSQ